MFDASKNMYGPLYYDIGWSIAGILFLLAAILIVVAVLFTTRKKIIKSLATLKIKEPKIVDIEALKQKYLGLIDQVERNFANHMIKASVAHQRLSLVVRLFYCEAVGIRADVMVLSDLKKSKYKSLVANIEKLYPNEFNTLEGGSVKNSAEEARKLVRDMQ